MRIKCTSKITPKYLILKLLFIRDAIEQVNKDSLKREKADLMKRKTKEREIAQQNIQASRANSNIKSRREMEESKCAHIELKHHF